jgi:hypothetical protein
MEGAANTGNRFASQEEITSSSSDLHSRCKPIHSLLYTLNGLKIMQRSDSKSSKSNITSMKHLSASFVFQRNCSCASIYTDGTLSRNRALSIRSSKKDGSSSSSSAPPRHGFSLSSLRGNLQPELSKKLYKLIKSENHLIQAYETAGKERLSIGSQLSEWGEATGDDAIGDISDKVGVLLAEIGEQEDLYAHNIDDSRAILKAIRNTEKSVQPSRDNKTKLADEIAKLRYKEPESAKLVILEQELVRAEAENLVAEAQLTNIVCPIPYILNDLSKLTRIRPAKRSRKHMLQNSRPLSNVLRSKSSSLVMVAVS